MAKRPKYKMSQADRAKQFMPFSALKGLEEALKERERIIVPKPELTADAEEVIDRKLRQIEPLKIITVIYYNEGECVKVTGIVAKINKELRQIRIVDTLINFDDILDVEL